MKTALTMAHVQQLEATRAGRGDALLARIESSIQRSPRVWMYALLAAGLAVRLWHASGTFLHPDEALHYFIANQTSWWLTYRASLSLSHPPFFILLLHAWRSVGTSEFALRVPSILAGMVFCWISFRWLGLLFRESVAWMGLVFLLFLPSSIDLSTEVRQYALLLAFTMGSAYLLELALAKNSAGTMLFSGVCLWLAILSHFSAFLFAASLGIYAIWRMWRNRPSIKFFVAWEAGQVVALGLCYFLYVTQISRLGDSYGGGSATHGWMANAYLGNSYFIPGKINPLLFIFARTGGVFQYAFGQSIIGDLAFVLFVIGVFLVFSRPALGRLNSQQLGFLLILPFALNCASALVRAYPYGGTRHSSFLLPFAIAGVSVTIAYFLKNRIALGMIAAVVIALLCNLFPSHRQPNSSRRDQSSANMKAALGFLREQVKAGDPIFADYQTSLMLDYYLCEQQPVTMNRSVAGFLYYECGGHKVISTDWNTDIFTTRNFYDQWHVMVSRFNLPSGSKVWVTQMGPSTHLAAELAKTPDFQVVSHDFGNNTHFFDVSVGQYFPDPARLPTS
jgi:4-amino-4-deoxy-L-arabinose transferase-like glycosyltransferase